jgi:hypothetical protein
MHHGAIGDNPSISLARTIAKQSISMVELNIQRSGICGTGLPDMVNCCLLSSLHHNSYVTEPANKIIPNHPNHAGHVHLLPTH